MADDKMKSEDMVPQADKPAHTEIAEREGKKGEQARLINKEEAERKEGEVGPVSCAGEVANSLMLLASRQQQPVSP